MFFFHPTLHLTLCTLNAICQTPDLLKGRITGMAQQCSDWSVFSDQYLHHPTVDWEGEECSRTDSSLLSFPCTVQNRWQAANLHSVRSACSKFCHRSTGAIRFWKEACYLTCYRQVLLYWPIFNAIIPELFIRPAPLPTAFSSPPEVQCWYCCRLTAFFFLLFFLCVSLMYFASRLTQLFPKIWTSNLCLFLFMWGHICSSTLWSPDIAQISGHMFCAITCSLMVVAFIFAA